MTYQELKEQLAGLSEEQLAKNVTFGAEGYSCKNVSLFIAEEDYINPSGDGAEPISAYDNEVDINGEPYDMANEEPVVIRKGEVILIDGEA